MKRSTLRGAGLEQTIVQRKRVDKPLMHTPVQLQVGLA